MPDYNPRHDPHWPDIVVSYLLHRYGQWVQLGRVYGADVWAVRDAVMVARRLGLVVMGDRRRGYCCVGFVRPRYVHLRHAAEWPPQGHAELPGQMTLLSEEA